MALHTRHMCSCYRCRWQFTDSSSFRAPPAGDSVGKGIGGVVGNVTNPKQTLFYFLVPKGLLYPQGCFCSGRLLELFGKIEFFWTNVLENTGNNVLFYCIKDIVMQWLQGSSAGSSAGERAAVASPAWTRAVAEAAVISWVEAMKRQEKDVSKSPDEINCSWGVSKNSRSCSSNICSNLCICSNSFHSYLDSNGFFQLKLKNVKLSQDMARLQQTQGCLPSEVGSSISPHPLWSTFAAPVGNRMPRQHQCSRSKPFRTWDLEKLREARETRRRSTMCCKSLFPSCLPKVSLWHRVTRNVMNALSWQDSKHSPEQVPSRAVQPQDRGEAMRWNEETIGSCGKTFHASKLGMRKS